MFEKRTRLRVKSLLEQQFNNVREFEQALENNLLDRRSLQRSTNERNMTRKTRLRQPRFHSAFQSGFCAVCHIPYNSLDEHLHSKKHLKLLGDDESYISLKGYDLLLGLDETDSFDVNLKRGFSPPRRSSKMPRGRALSAMGDRIKDVPMSPIGSDSGHRLRSRKNINYMTPPLDEDSLPEKPEEVVKEVAKEYRELRSSTRLLAKLTEQLNDNDEVWNSGRPKRACHRHRISLDEKFFVDNKISKKDEFLSKLRSAVQNNHDPKRAETPMPERFWDKELLGKRKSVRNSELARLNNEAENFLFPKKDDVSDDDEEDVDEVDDKKVKHNAAREADFKNFRIDDEESLHSTSSESKCKKKRRTHAEAFIMDNQKYYKFETPGSRLRYQGSYLSPVPPTKIKHNGDCVIKKEKEPERKVIVKPLCFNLEKYEFSFERVPKEEDWFKTFQRIDNGEEKYILMNNENFWNPFILPYQLDYIPPLDPKVCISQYNEIRKRFVDTPSSTSTSVTCSTPDPNASNSSVESPFHQDEDSKISVSSISTIDEQKTIKRGSVNTSGNSKKPRKSPRQHASTLAILSSLIQQRRRKTKCHVDFRVSNLLPTILEEPRRFKRKNKVDYGALLRQADEEFARISDETLMDIQYEKNNIVFKNDRGLADILRYDDGGGNNIAMKPQRGKPGRKPGKRKKNRTGWPMNRYRRVKREHIVKEDDESTIDSISVIAEDSDDNHICEEVTATDSIKTKKTEKQNGENNNQSDVNINNKLGSNCDVNSDNRVVNNTDCVLKLTNSDLKYQPYVRVQKLEKNNIDRKSEPAKRSNSPRRKSRGQRRMPASPKSPRMLRRPRGRWYRER